MRAVGIIPSAPEVCGVGRKGIVGGYEASQGFA